MKRSVLMAGVVGVLVMVCAGGCRIAEPAAKAPEERGPNLVQNGSFEEGVAGWRVQGATTEAVQLDNADFMAGKNGMRIAHAAETGASSVTQSVGLAPNASYTLTLAVKTEGLEPGKGAQIAVRESGVGETNLATSPLQLTNGRWQPLTVPFQTRSCPKVDIVLSFKGKGKAWFDDVRLVQGTAGVAAVPAEKPEEKNIAKGKSCVFSTPPNYGLCTDPDDAKQLTDGIFTTGYFWTQKSTVGWQSNSLILITIDLGSVEPIGGISFSAAAGVAHVGWPESIVVLVSEDGKAYYMLDDLVNLAEGGRPSAEGYRTFTYRTHALSTKGRYVRLAIAPSGEGKYCFCDEIEVYRGKDADLAKAYVGSPIPVDNFLFSLRYQTRLQADVAAGRERLAASTISASEKKRIGAEMAEVEAAVKVFSFQGDPKSFRAIVPYNDVHRRIFALHGRILAAEGSAPLTIWHKYRYAPLGLWEKPVGGTPELELRMMRNEHRAEVLNLTNATTAPMQIRLKVEGLPGGTNPGYLTAYQVEYVDTRETKVLADALVAMKNEAGVYATTIPAGMTRQVWFSFFPKDIAPGKHSGKIIVEQAGKTSSVPFSLNVASCAMPDKTDLCTPLWDYADAPAYGMTVKNREAAIADMKSHYVTLALGGGKVGAKPAADGVDGDGNLTKPLDFTAFDEWIKLWSGARHYQVYHCVLPQTTFAGKKPGTEAFARAMKQWAEAWEKHAVAMGLTNGKLQFAFLDEPNTKEQYEVSRLWNEAFKAGSKEIKLFVDPQFSSETMKFAPQSLEAADILCPLMAQYNEGGDDLRQMFEQFKAKGKQLWFYMAHGPNRLYDPSYFRLQFWYCHRYGAVGSGFWAYGDTGGVPSNWNEYIAERGTSYSLPYLDPEGVTPSKHWEAYREGIEDNQYLTMLAAGGEEARRLAARLAEETTVSAEKITKKDPRIPWVENTPCALADEARLKALDMLQKLTPKR